MNRRTPMHRILAVDLSSRGFAYAVFDGFERLVDWGARRVAGDKNSQSVDGIRALIHWYTPDALVLEDTQALRSRRRPRITVLSEQVVRLAERLALRVVSVRWSLVQRVIGGSASATKEQVAARVAEMFPELERYVPPKRKLWMSEDDRMNLFDAAALGTTASLPTIRATQPSTK